MEHANTRTMGLDLNELRRRGADAVTHRFTEADIAQLEAEDLTDPWISAMLNLAYRQNDPEQATIHAIRREPSRSGAEPELRRGLADAEAELEKRPERLLRTVQTSVCTNRSRTPAEKPQRGAEQRRKQHAPGYGVRDHRHRHGRRVHSHAGGNEMVAPLDR